MVGRSATQPAWPRATRRVRTEALLALRPRLSPSLPLSRTVPTGGAIVPINCGLHIGDARANAWSLNAATMAFRRTGRRELCHGRASIPLEMRDLMPGVAWEPQQFLPLTRATRMPCSHQAPRSLARAYPKNSQPTHAEHSPESGSLCVPYVPALCRSPPVSSR
jgi:hypothetical protein